jgi:hypothetical protein
MLRGSGAGFVLPTRRPRSYSPIERPDDRLRRVRHPRSRASVHASPQPRWDQKTEALAWLETGDAALSQPQS